MRAQPRMKMEMLFCMAAMLLGCATVRPVPVSSQPLATTTVADVVVSVPRLDVGDYPGDILDIATAVLVVIENRSNHEIQVDPEGFLLGPEGGTLLSPIAPQQLALKSLTPPANQSDGDMLAAWRGGGGGFRGSVGAPRSGGFMPRGSVGGRIGAPGGWGFRGGGFRGRLGPYAGYTRWGFWSGGPLFWGSNWYAGWYGSPWFGPWFYDGPRYYAWSRDDALRLALPSSRLPPGARSGGFLYYPRLEHAEGQPLVLQWSIREATTQQVLGTMQLPLEMRAD